jgi:hypothetical protein
MRIALMQVIAVRFWAAREKRESTTQRTVSSKLIPQVGTAPYEVLYVGRPRLGRGAPISGTPPASIAEPEVFHNRPSYEEAIDQRPWAMGQGPLRAGPGKSGAKRICSFQLRRYLVTWYSCTPGEHSPA